MTSDSAHPKPLDPPIALPLFESEGHACSYLPGRVARTRAFAAGRMPGSLYHRFMDAGFRRSGEVVYQPTCAGCRRCVPIRIPVGRFELSKSQRRVMRRNADLRITVERDATATDEKFELYRRYVREWHGKGEEEPDPREGFEAFLYRSPVETIEFAYREPGTGRLLAVGLCDVCPESLSTVYFYFDPAHSQRSLGTYGLLREIEFARECGVPYYYLGYWVEGAATMDYKARFVPHEVLGGDGVWRSR